MMQGLSGNRVFAPARDIVQLFPQVIGYHAVLRLAALQVPPALRKYAEENGVTQLDLIATERAFAEFVRLTVHYACDDFNDVWEKSGMAKLNPVMIIALTAVVGEVTMGVFYKTVRAATRQGRNVQGIDGLEQVVDMAASALKDSVGSSKVRRIMEAEGAALPSILENTPSENNP